MSQFAFQRTGDANYPRHLKILVMGPPKSGKTTFLSTAPNVVVAAVEAGLMSIAHKDIGFVDVDSTEKLQTLHMILADETMRKQAAKQLGLPDIETVAIDTLDAWQELMKKEILAENRRTAFQRDDWGTLKERMAAILKAFVALPINVIFTVHTDMSQDEEQRMVYAPGIQGSLKNDLAGYVDFSLLSFRQRETDTNGLPVIKYYLKNEGDLKNPHLGNRAAGRLPEICAPQFSVLHDAVFSAVGTPRAVVIEEAVEAVVAPLVGIIPAEGGPIAEAVPAPIASQPAPALPTGVPTDDSGNPINAAGVTMLTKQYAANGLTVPADLESWTLGKARSIAKFFTGWKAMHVTGDATRDDLVVGLTQEDAFAGEMEGVQVGTKPAKAATETVTPEPPVVEVTMEQAEDLVVAQAGGVVIGRSVAEGALCADCDKPIDDVDIANLALRRYQRALCVTDYKAETRK